MINFPLPCFDRNRKRRKEDNASCCRDKSNEEIKDLQAQRALVFDVYHECIEDLHEYLSVLYDVKTSERDEMVSCKQTISDLNLSRHLLRKNWTSH